MTIQELIDALTEQAEVYGDHAEVLLAFQPKWPLAFNVERVIAHEEIAGSPASDIVWIAATDSHPEGRSPYAPDIWNT